MRFFIKAYAMHEDELGAVSDEKNSGGLETDDIHEGVIEGTADEETIKRLADRGVVVQAVAPVPDQPAAEPGPDEPIAPPDFGAGLPGGVAGFGIERVTVGPAVGQPRVFRRAPAAPRPSGPEYWLLDLLSGLTDRVVNQIEGAGAEIIERDPSGSFVVRTTAGSDALRGLPFIGSLRRYGIEETIEGAASLLPDAEPEPGLARAARRPAGRSRAAATRRTGPRKDRFEAICHRAEDSQAVAQQIGTAGGKVLGVYGRTVRFIASRGDLEAVADIEGVASIAKKSAARLLTDHALPLIGMRRVPPQPAEFPFDGTGEIVGVADTGLDDTHEDFNGRIVGVVALGRTGNATDPDGHGTHVAGTIVGDGSASRPQGQNHGLGPLRGVAPAARLHFQSILDANGGLGGLPDNLADLFQPAYDAGVRVHNNSWGAYLQGRYDTTAMDVDQFVYDNPDFLPVIAAGNEGSCVSVVMADPGFVAIQSLGAPATSKNGLTVGASRSDRTSGGYSNMTWGQAWPEDFDDPPIADETVSGNPKALAAFSSRGPCDDERIKPDLVAPGTDIAATRSALAPMRNFWGAYPDNRSYAFMGGTSMACPIVAGCAVLVRQYYRTQAGHQEPSAALLKATLINGTDRLDAADAIARPDGDPNYHQGFGRIDMAKTLPDPAQPSFDLFFVDTWKRDAAQRFTQRGGRRRWSINIQQAGELRITLCWTDFPGRALQNQLRLILDTRRNGQPVNWIANEKVVAPRKVPAHDPRDFLPGQTNVVTRDPHNNVQVIRADVQPGIHTLALFADSLIRLPQDFALVVTFPRAGATIVED
jgi:hypothetical protein